MSPLTHDSLPNPTDRVFLGWSQPLLPLAAAHLVEHYAADGSVDLRRAMLVLPGGRARRRMVELLLDEADRRGLTLVPPASTTVGGLPDALHTSLAPVADDATSRRAWSLALRSVDRASLQAVFPRLPSAGQLGDWDEIARLLSELHESVAGEGHRFRDVAAICNSGMLFDDGPRWQTLALVQERYLRILDEVGLVDRYASRMAALASGVTPFERDLWLVSVVDLPAVTRRLIEASGAAVHALIHAPEGLDDAAGPAFEAFGLPRVDYWHDARVPVTDDSVLRVVESPADQADAVLDFLGELGGRYAAEDVVAAVHPESDVVPFLEQRLEARGVPPRYAAGTRLAHTGPLRLLEAVADYAEDRGFLALAALLRHPDAGPLIQPSPAFPDLPTRVEAIDAADRFFNEHLPHRLQGHLPRGQRRAARFPVVVRALERGGPLSRLEGRRRLSEWMPVVRDLLLAAYGEHTFDRSKPAHRHLLDVLGRVRTAAVSLATLPPRLDEPCSGSAAIQTLLLELRDDALPPDPRRGAVELLDWLEVPLDDAPVVMLTGFNEGLLPKSVSGHAFLPDALRSRLGLVDNRGRMARDAYRLTTVLHSKASVCLIAGRRTSQGDPLRPSRLMFRIPDEELAARVLTFFKSDGVAPIPPSLASLGLTPGATSDFMVPPEPVLELTLEEVPTRFRVTEFKAILADPYRYVLERIYDLDSVDDGAREMDPMVFGSLVHDVLQRFGMMALESPPAVDVSDAGSVRGALLDLLEQLVAERFGDAALPAVALQVGQLEARLAAFADAQAAWSAQGWRIVAIERQPDGEGVPIEVDGEPVWLRGRIDRIDFNPSTGEWAVLDYKTSNKAETPEKAHQKGRGDQRQWVDLQLPLYRWLLKGIVDAEGRPVVDPVAVRQGRVKLGYVTLPKDTRDTKFLLANWTDDDLADAEQVARDAVAIVREARFEFDPAVTKPSWYGGDALEPLLARGWQAAGVEDDGGWSEDDGSPGGDR
ncbi:MAG TPA: PD-(D/E)XK nuclease family protein [Longimicrobiales bacterium]|nr:PD-(D/E)XK nuclease family protein [Longimicrobiales bacterium]